MPIRQQPNDKNKQTPFRRHTTGVCIWYVNMLSLKSSSQLKLKVNFKRNDQKSGIHNE